MLLLPIFFILIVYRAQNTVVASTVFICMFLYVHCPDDDLHEMFKSIFRENKKKI